MVESEEELKSLLMKVKEKSEKAGLKLSAKKMKIMASGPITSWQIDGETRETVTDFIFLGSRITADGDCSHEIKRHLLLGRKAMTNLNSILKRRDKKRGKGINPRVHCLHWGALCESWSLFFLTAVSRRGKSGSSDGFSFLGLQNH